MQGCFQSALLLGSDHTELDEVAIEVVTPNLAIGISSGRFPKGYPHADPNEDAVFATTDGVTTILAVADGHHGFDAARAAITAIAEAARAPTDEAIQSIVRRLTVTPIDAVTATVPPLPRLVTRTARLSQRSMVVGPGTRGAAFALTKSASVGMSTVPDDVVAVVDRVSSRYPPSGCSGPSHTPAPDTAPPGSPILGST